MVRVISRRVLASIVSLLGMLVLVFVLGRLTGSPATLYLPPGAQPGLIDAFNRANGFDRPLWEQFVAFVGDAARLDLGESIWQRRPAIEVVLLVMPPTLFLAAVAMTLSLAVSFALGVTAARHAGRLVDRVVTLFSLTVASIPDFWFALIGVLIFAVQLGILPTSGQSGLSSWVLPIATLMLGPVGAMTQVVRGSMVESLASGFVLNARSRGFGPTRLAYRHALRNAVLPVIAVAGDKAAGMVNGSIIVGTVFAWPGIGTVMVQAVVNRDFALIQTGVLVIGVTIIALNILVDLVYSIVDPRIRQR